METIADKLNLKDKNIANLIKTIEESAIKPLLEQGLIHSYEKEEGLNGLKFIIHRVNKDQLKNENRSMIARKYKRDKAGSVKYNVGSVKYNAGSVKQNHI